MDNENFATLLICLTILGVITLLYGGYYVNRESRYDNFQEIIKELPDEQKCLHICGFEFRNIFEKYKLCISECGKLVKGG